MTGSEKELAVRLAVTFGAILALVLVSGCGGTTVSPVPPTAGGPTATAGGPTATAGGPTATPAAITCNATGTGTAVSIQGFAFNPGSASVANNGFVTWTNNDSTSHTVTFDSGPNCGTLAGGATTTVQFTVPGTYPYHCNIHPSMKGTIVVS